MINQGIGAAVRRKEDRRFITGRGRYTGDRPVAGQLHAAFLRSPYAHAGVQINAIDDALAAPGVVAVLTGADMAADGLRAIPINWTLHDADGSAMFVPPHVALADDVVRFVGEPYAVVIAETIDQAKDAAERVDVEFDERPAIANLAAARAPGAHAVWPDAPDNIGLRWTNGDKAATDDLFARAAHITKLDLVNTRLAPTPVEPRIAIGSVEADGRLLLTCATQLPHELRRMLATDVFGIPETDLRVIAPDVGGGFGMKCYIYPDEVTVLWAARRLGRTVRWTSDRSEAFLADHHGRDHLTHAELALDETGRFLAMRVETAANMGAYLSQHASAVPTVYSTYVLPGPYRFEAVHAEIHTTFTHTVPIDAYRGAGRSEAVYVTERLVDQAARELARDPADLRRQNMVAPADLPYVTAVGSNFDSGDPPALLNHALKLANHDELEARRAASRAANRYRGFGLSAYAASCGNCSSARDERAGIDTGSWESARLRLHPTGSATLFLGTHSHGQSHETVFAQIVAERLGLDLNQVEVVFGDTDRVQQGLGSFFSRSAVIAGPAVLNATDRVLDKAKQIAAHMLEASAADIELCDGAFRIAGTDREVAFNDVATQAYVPTDFPHDTLEPGLEEACFYDPKDFTWPMGVHVAEVEIDAATGLVRLERYIAVDDVGQAINPMVVEGQVQGGAVQGIGQALWEEVIYDPDTGQLLTGSPMDYGLPRADRLPDLTSDLQPTMTATNALGAKGAGEVGTIAAPAAVMNAVIDALAPLGIYAIDMPATPDKVWRAIKQATG
ncbi:MAG: xanthine dehydrogenase family protein molybdopterin-binding subunit [Pseudomonadota bacterium]